MDLLNLLIMMEQLMSLDFGVMVDWEFGMLTMLYLQLIMDLGFGLHNLLMLLMQLNNIILSVICLQGQINGNLEI